MSKQITVKAGGRHLTMSGTFETYLKWYDGWDASIGAHWKAVKDLPRGALCIDVGANIGIVSVTLAAMRPDLQIIAIEPVPDNVRNLRLNVEANDLKNIEVVGAAVGDREGHLQITDNGPWSTPADEGATITVPVITLDRYADQPVAFVKVDTEGYEPNVFAGARELFAKQKPLVLTEFNSWSLMLHGYSPVVFSRAIWRSFDILGLYHNENLVTAPADELSIVHENITAHGSVSDVLLRPKARLPELDDMVFAPEIARLRRENGLRAA